MGTLMPDLLQLFAGLELTVPPSATSAYVGAAIPNTLHHIGRDHRRRPVVLLTASETDARPAAMRFRNLQIDHGVRCRIQQVSNQIIDSHFSVIQCCSDDPILQRSFLDLLGTIVDSLPSNPTQREVAELLERLAALFLAIERPARRAAQGLWGELFTIEHSRNPMALAEAWHNDVCERYDFASGRERLEIKTSSDRTRQHHFSHEQLHPADGVQCVIASMYVEPLTGGRSLGSLWDSVRDLVAASAGLRARVDEVCLAALGETWQESRLLAFDEQLARSSVAYFDVHDVPRLPQQLPDGISQVRLRVDLSSSSTVIAEVREMSPLFEFLDN